MSSERDRFGAPIDPTVNQDFPFAGKSPQPTNQRTLTRAAKALLDPTLTTAELDGYAAKLRAEAGFQHGMFDAGAAGATALVGELSVPVAAAVTELYADTRYAQLGGSLMRAGRAPLS